MASRGGQANDRKGRQARRKLRIAPQSEKGLQTMKKIKTLAAAAVVAVSLFSMQGDAMAAEDNTISVRGIAKQEVAPDMAYLTLGISVKGDTAESVRTQAAEASQKVRRALLGMAISENNIQSSSYNLYPLPSPEGPETNN